jgi:hypothetical protein
MDGYGSGRQGGRVTVESTLRLDVDAMIRRRVIQPGAHVDGDASMLGAGPGWTDRIEVALTDGSISLPAAAALIAEAAAVQQEGAGRGGL